MKERTKLLAAALSGDHSAAHQWVEVTCEMIEASSSEKAKIEHYLELCMHVVAFEAPCMYQQVATSLSIDTLNLVYNSAQKVSEAIIKMGRDVTGFSIFYAAKAVENMRENLANRDSCIVRVSSEHRAQAEHAELIKDAILVVFDYPFRLMERIRKIVKVDDFFNQAVDSLFHQDEVVRLFAVLSNKEGNDTVSFIFTPSIPGQSILESSWPSNEAVVDALLDWKNGINRGKDAMLRQVWGIPAYARLAREGSNSGSL